MSIDAEFHAFAGDVREFQGKVLSSLDNLDHHVSSVSRKADEIREDLKVHEKEDGAHGVRVGYNSISGLAPWVAIATSIIIPILMTWSSR